MRKIWTIDNKQEKKLLGTKLKKFNFDNYSPKEIDVLIKEMDESMKEANGIGLSANQVGWDMRVFVARWDGKFYAIFNPKLEKFSKEKDIFEEGCLSIPGQFGEVVRPDGVTLKGFNKKGEPIVIKARGMVAKIFQHEVDHLNGKVFVSRMKRRAKLRSKD